VTGIHHDPRSIAYRILADYQQGRIDRLDDALDAEFARSEQEGDERDAALCRELIYGVARHQQLYDHLALRFLRRDQRQPLPLLGALRLAAHQFFALDRIPPHAVGSVMVEVLRAHGHDHLCGVANAVIRKLAQLRSAERHGDGPEGRLPPEVIPDDPIVRFNLPRPLINDLEQVLQADPALSLADLNRLPHLCTRTLIGRTVPKLRGVLRQQGPWTWWDDPAEALHGPVADGLCVVQDFSQGVVVDACGVRPGDLVLDACAAPGGKARSMAERGARVIAADVSLDKVAEMRSDKIEGALLVQDGTAPALCAAFDLVMVDAPCSNSGVLARRPEARLRYDARNLDNLRALQRSLLSAAAALVKPDGRLAYSTCSVSPRENQGIAHELTGWRVLNERSLWPTEWQAGGYVAVLVRS
jgi:16S rRNA (cytosine967-C5)-methyltransferase